MNQCSCALDLPNGASLRTQLLEKKDELAGMLDTSSDTNHIIISLVCSLKLTHKNDQHMDLKLTHKNDQPMDYWCYCFSVNGLYLRLANADDEETDDLVEAAGDMVGLPKYVLEN